MNFLHISGKIYRGQSLTRILMDLMFRSFEIEGKVVDVGGGRSPDYFNYFIKKDVISIEALDASITGIDFEKDALPFARGSVDTIVLANVLEHIYNHDFLILETYRSLRSGGKLIGFVPFLLGYHADPHDYFRYTPEALERMLSKAGFAEINVERVGGGAFYANCNNVILSVPRLIRPIVFAFYFILDKAFLSLRPDAAKRFALGYVFSGKK